jgi:hypothetical protein
MLRLKLDEFAGEPRLRRASMDARVKPAHDEQKVRPIQVKARQ